MNVRTMRAVTGTNCRLSTIEVDQILTDETLLLWVEGLGGVLGVSFLGFAQSGRGGLRGPTLALHAVCGPAKVRTDRHHTYTSRLNS